ncbi:hypothetical protein Hanom_Chr03g00217931 [Helianthus anomalus]
MDKTNYLTPYNLNQNNLLKHKTTCKETNLRSTSSAVYLSDTFLVSICAIRSRAGCDIESHILS